MSVVCPGRAVELPETGTGVQPGGYLASPACVTLYGEVVAAVHAHPPVLGRWHQTTTDAYTAQHVGPATKPIAVWFALNSLHLVLERGLTGPEARAAHGHLATTQPASTWRPLEPPAAPAPLTVLDVALADDAEEQVVATRRWATAVWESWAHVHDEVRDATTRQLAGWRD